VGPGRVEWQQAVFKRKGTNTYPRMIERVENGGGRVSKQRKRISVQSSKKKNHKEENTQPKGRRAPKGKKVLRQITRVPKKKHQWGGKKKGENAKLPNTQDQRGILTKEQKKKKKKKNVLHFFFQRKHKIQNQRFARICLPGIKKNPLKPLTQDTDPPITREGENQDLKVGRKDKKGLRPYCI